MKNIRLLLPLLAVLFSNNDAFSQECPPITTDICGTCATISAPLTYTNQCPGTPVVVGPIVSSGSPFTFHNYSWSATSGIATTVTPGAGGSATINATIIAPASTQIYTLTDTSYGPNLIQNGTFEDPWGTGIHYCFVTQYQDGSGPSGFADGHEKIGGWWGDNAACLVPEFGPMPGGVYNPAFDLLTHSGGPGSKMLDVRGATGIGHRYCCDIWGNEVNDNDAESAPAFFWAQDVNLCTGETYHFTAYIRLMSHNLPGQEPQIRVALGPAFANYTAIQATTSLYSFTPTPADILYGGAGGQNIGDSTGICDPLWYAISFDFVYTGPTTTKLIYMSDMNGMAGGNDFSIDDISLNRVCTRQTTVTISPPNPAPSLPSGVYACAGQPFQFILNGTNGNQLNYDISFTPSGALYSIPMGSSTAIISGGTCSSIPVTAPGAGTLTLTITSLLDAPSCSVWFPCSLPYSIPVWNGGSITGPDHICGIGHSITLANPTITGPSPYNWTNSSPGVATLPSPPYSWSEVLTAVGTGTTTITSSRGTTCNATKDVSVYDPLLSFSTSRDPYEGCVGQPMTLTLTGIVGETIKYNITLPGTTTPGPNITTTFTSSTIILPYTPTHDGTLILTIVKSVVGPCTFTTPIIFTKTILVTPTTGVIENTIQCGNELTGLLYSGIPATGGTWTSYNEAVEHLNPGSPTTTLTGVSVADVSATTIVNVSYAFTNSCGSIYTIQPVTINPAPHASVTYSGCPRVCPGTPLTFTIHSPAGTTVNLNSGVYYHDMGTSTTWDITIPATSIPYTSLGITTVTNDITGCVRPEDYGSYGLLYPDARVEVPTAYPKAKIHTPGPIKICPGAPFQFEVRGDPGNIVVIKDAYSSTFTVTIGTDGSVMTPLLTTSPNTYCIQSVQYPCGSCIAVAPAPSITHPCINVENWPAPVIALAHTTPPCGTSSFVLHATGAAPTYTWSGPGFTTFTTPGTVHHHTVSPGVGGVYTVSATSAHGCTSTATTTVTMPVIAGSTTLCLGGSTTLTDPTPGGYWICTTPSVATIGTFTGNLHAVGAGTATVTYNAPIDADGHYCKTFATVTVHKMPNITGINDICGIGNTTVFTDAAPGGHWQSGNTSVATVSPITGSTTIATAAGYGTSIITYTGWSAAPACVAYRPLSVDPSFAPITGPTTVCMGSTINLYDITSGGTWSSSNNSIASVNSSGMVTPVSPGTVVITYGSSSALCSSTTTITVLSVPTACASYVEVPGPGCGSGVDGAWCYEWYINATPYSTVTFNEGTLDYVGGTGYCGCTGFTHNMGAASTWGPVPNLCTTCPSTAILSGVTIVSVTAGGCTGTLCPLIRESNPALTGIGSIQTNTENGILLKVIPNPNNGQFTLQGNFRKISGEAYLEVVNMLGKAVFSGTVNINDGEVNKNIDLGSDLAAGIYLLKIKSDQESQVIRFTIDK